HLAGLRRLGPAREPPAVLPPQHRPQPPAPLRAADGTLPLPPLRPGRGHPRPHRPPPAAPLTAWSWADGTTGAPKRRPPAPRPVGRKRRRPRRAGTPGTRAAARHPAVRVRPPGAPARTPQLAARPQRSGEDRAPGPPPGPGGAG